MNASSNKCQEYWDTYLKEDYNDNPAVSGEFMGSYRSGGQEVCKVHLEWEGLADALSRCDTGIDVEIGLKSKEVISCGPMDTCSFECGLMDGL